MCQHEDRTVLSEKPSATLPPEGADSHDRDLPTAEPGDRVRVHYVGTLVDGTPFSSSDGALMEFVVGNAEVMPGLDLAVLGMAPGDRREVLIPAHQAYGEVDQALVMEIDREAIPRGTLLKAGERCTLRLRGVERTVTLLAITPLSVTVDANHPLAGQDLIYTLDMVEVSRPAVA